MPVMRLGAQVSIFLGAAILVGSPLKAFGPEGHRLVGDVATWHLCPDARREVKQLLEGESLSAGRQLARLDTFAAGVEAYASVALY